ncbi:MAG: DUF3172 domain-containing protein [Cyanobacteria bacterium CRU_2_1]|nr:DUF3172 domain-containing protein [Cyanobacteria bacterium CRU_2_1]
MRRKPKAPPRSSSRSPENYDYSERSDRFERPADRSDRSPVTNILNVTTLAVLAAALVVGIGVGMFLGTSTNSSDLGSVATRYDIERSAPDPELCVQYGASAIVVDLRAFLTLNPFNAYLSQPTMQPGCVIRSSNWSILQSRNLINSQDVNECRNRMNTFGYTGSIENQTDKPKINCVYQNDAAGNLFLTAPGLGNAPPETQRF